MRGYYQKKLAAQRLRKCYRVAPERVQQYLRAEMDFVIRQVSGKNRVLDLGCGYGRTIPQLAESTGQVIAIDLSAESIHLALRLCRNIPNCRFLQMDAARLAFAVDRFDAVICIQNGISAFHTDPRQLMQEALRVTLPSGIALFSTYASQFWPLRLEWFRKQSEAGLLGEIDEEKTGNGVIACKDGFRAMTYSRERFTDAAAGLDADVRFVEVDDSSLFCILTKNGI